MRTQERISGGALTRPLGRQGAVSCKAQVEGARREPGCENTALFIGRGRRVRELLPGGVLCLKSEVPVVGAGMDSLRR